MEGQPSASRADIAQPLVTGDSIRDVQELPRAAKDDGEAPRADAVLEQEAVKQAPPQVASAVALLAKARYREDLDMEPRPPKPRGRPPNVLKRPAAKPGMPNAKKKPAAAVSSPSVSIEETSRQVVSMKKPSAKQMPQSKPSVQKTVTKAQRMRQRPHGRATCRKTPGCCPSCWKKRGYEVLT